MRFLFVTWAGGGNSTPVLGLATRLMRRGHEVKVVSPNDSTARFAAVNVEYEVLAPGAHNVFDAITRSRPDAVVVDFMMPEWLCDAEAAGVPPVALVHTLYDRVAVGIMTAFTTIEALNAGRADLGLDPIASAPELLDRMARVLVSSYRELEDESVGALPPNVVHVGAILEEPGDDQSWTPPWSGDEPMVVGTLGTTPGLDDHVVLARLCEAVASLPVHLLVNAGSHLDTSGLHRPDNVVITGYVRHAAVMPHADVVVTHGGLGGTLAALSFGHPTVSIPLGRDQPHNAMRAAAVGAGLALASDASAADIRAALELVLSDSSYRTVAESFASRYDPSASAAIEALEGVS